MPHGGYNILVAGVAGFVEKEGDNILAVVIGLASIEKKTNKSVYWYPIYYCNYDIFNKK